MSTATDVRISARAVAAGIERMSGGRWRGRILILLSPVRPPANEVGPVRLEDWPKAVRDLFDQGVWLHVSAVGPRSDILAAPDPNSPCIRVSPVLRHPAPRATRGGPAGSGAEEESLLKLWETAVGPDLPQLRAALPMGPPRDTPELIIPDGTTSAALVLASLRARHVLDRVRLPGVPAPDPARPAASAGPELRRAAAADDWLALATSAEEAPDHHLMALLADCDAAMAAHANACAAKTETELRKACIALAQRTEATSQANARSVANAATGRPERDAGAEALLGPARAAQELPLPNSGQATAETSKEGNAALGRLFALRGFPSLQRLFNLCVEVVIEGTELDRLFGAVSFDDGSERGTARYGFLSVALPSGAGAEPVVWTIAKLRQSEIGIPNLFLPAAQAELDARGEAGAFDANLPRDGLLPIGAATVGTLPRFEVTTLDAAASLLADTAAYGNNTQLRDNTQIRKRPPGQSVGLALLDRGVADAVIRRAARCRRPGPLVLDAEDLTVGYRLDVGLDVKGDPKRRTWRALNRRLLRFDPANQHMLGPVSLEQVVDRLFGTDRGTRRAEADAAPFVPTVERRMAPARDDPSKAVPVLVANEELVRWTGDPIGLDPSGQNVEVDVEGLTLDIDFDLPTEGLLPPRLCWGWRYAYGLACIFDGGYAVPPVDAEDRYDSKGGESFTLPQVAPQIGGRAARRQEPIGAPLVLPTLAGTRPVGPFPAAAVSDLVVRTAQDSRDSRPARVRRILLPPSVTVAFAATHNAFSGRPAEDRLIGGLRWVDFDASWRASDGRQRENGFPVVERIKDAFTVRRSGTMPAGGQAVFMKRDSAQGVRRRPFLPDPLGSQMVLRLTRRERPDEALGDPVVVPLYQRADGGGIVPTGFPDAVPIVLDLMRVGWRRRGTRAPLRLPYGTELRSWNEEDEPTVLLPDGGMPVRHVVVELEPGEDVRLETWILPTRAALVHALEAVEGTASLCTAVGRGETVDERFYDGLRSLTGLTFDLAPLGIKSAPSLGRQEMPGPAAMAAWARLLHDILRVRPVPEIAAVTELRLVHAATAVAPEPAGPDVPPPVAFGSTPVRLHRRKSYTAEEIVAKLQQAEALTGQGKSRPEVVQAIGVTESIYDRWLKDFGGRELDEVTRLIDQQREQDAPVMVEPIATIAVDTERVGRVEITAVGPGAARGIIDDPARGRSPLQRVRGDGLQGGTEQKGFDERLYGFRVCPDGTVEPVDETVPLIDLVDLAEPSGPRLGAPPATVRTDGSPDDVREGRRILLPALGTGVAHRVRLKATATSRTMPWFRYDDVKANAPAAEPWPVTSTTVAVLPAERRPDPIVPAFSLAPSFRWDTAGSDAAAGRAVLTRHGLVRVTQGRPFHTAGPLERFAVVVWPPWIARLRPQDMARDHIGRRDPGLRPSMNLDGFSDADLGPGGRFVTRWGADPIRAGEGPHGWLPPLSAFVGAQVWPNEAGETDPWPDAPDGAVALDVPMPLPVPAGEVPGSAGTLNVGLVTYRPRFDRDREVWFADIEVVPRRPPPDGADGPGVDVAAWPFVRLGLVRFNPDAPVELQASEPVALWTQPPPRRTVTVRAGGKAGLPGALIVRVEGPGGGPASPGNGTAPRLRVSLVHIERLAGGIVTDAIRDASGAPVTLDLEPTLDSGHLVWERRMELPTDASARLALELEELETLRTTEAADKKSESAPRFSALVEVPS